jgi:hypothetical protein
MPAGVFATGGGTSGSRTSGRQGRGGPGRIDGDDTRGRRPLLPVVPKPFRVVSCILCWAVDWHRRGDRAEAWHTRVMTAHAALTAMAPAVATARGPRNVQLKFKSNIVGSTTAAQAAGSMCC